jgi:hypothetical protein
MITHNISRAANKFDLFLCGPWIVFIDFEKKYCYNGQTGIKIYCVADPVFFNPWIRIRNPGCKRIQSKDLGSGLNIPDLIFETLESVFGLQIIKFFGEDQDLESCQPWIRIWDKHPGSATLSRHTSETINSGKLPRLESGKTISAEFLTRSRSRLLWCAHRNLTRRMLESLTTWKHTE